MNSNLKKYIICTILDKNLVHLNKDKYQMLIKIINTGEYNEDICAYIFRCVIAKCNREKIIPNDINILNILTTDYCVDKAYEYLLYLLNNHEDDYEIDLAR